MLILLENDFATAIGALSQKLCLSHLPQELGSLFTFLPLLPFCLVGLVRYVAHPPLGFRVFNAADLALTMGIISLFVYQSLSNYNFPLENPDKEDEVNVASVIHLACAIVFIIFFALIENYTVLWKEVGHEDYKLQVDMLSFLTFGFALVSIRLCIDTQKSFKLKARL